MIPIVRTVQLTQALAEYRAAEAELEAAMEREGEYISDLIDKARRARRVLCLAVDSAERISAMQAELQDSLNDRGAA